MIGSRAFLEDLRSRYEPWPTEVIRSDRFPGALHHALLNHERFRLILAAFERFGGDARRVLDLGVYPGTLPRLLRRYAGRPLEVEGAGICFDAGFRELMAAEGVRLHEVDLDPPPRVPESALRYPARLALADASVDFVFLTEVIEHLVWPRSALAEAARVLRPGGRIVITTPNASRVGGLLKQLAGGSAQEPILDSHIFTPPENEWRGHVRLYSMDELAILLERAGLAPIHRAWYTSGMDRFRTGGAARRAWLALRRVFFLVPWLRNDLLIVGEKR